MNQKQRIALWIGGSLFFLSVMFVPWVPWMTHVPTGRTSPAVGVKRSYRLGKPEASLESKVALHYKLDAVRYFSLISVVVVGTGIAYFTLADRKALLIADATLADRK